jgi:hypothetical protein
MAQDRRATLILSVQQNGPTEQVIRTRLQDAGIRVLSCAVTYMQTAHVRKMRCELQWRTPPADLQTPDVVKQLAELPGVDRLKWQM